MKLTKMTFTGDILLNGGIIDFYKTDDNKYNFDSIFENIKPFLLESDYVVGNLETPITNNYEEIQHTKYRFTSPIDFAEAVKKGGVDLVTTANNHCLDNGFDGVKKTNDCLDKIKLNHTGVFITKNTPKRYEILNINNIKIAIFSYTYGTNAFSNKRYLTRKNKDIQINLLQKQELSNPLIRQIWRNKNIIFKILRKILRTFKLFQLNKPIHERKESSYHNKKQIKKQIKQAKNEGAEYIIMCIHEGGQFNTNPIKKAIKTVEFMQKNGADLIISNHEHVIQKVEIKNNKLVTYSLGNFLSAQGVLEEPYDKMAEYSILINIYLKKENQELTVEKNTFTIVKTVIDKEKNSKALKVKLLYDMINECKDMKEKEKLMEDNQKIVKNIINRKIKINDIRKEYKI